MPNDDREFQKEWKRLAELISREHDRSKVVALTQEVIDMLDEYSREHDRAKKSA